MNKTMNAVKSYEQQKKKDEVIGYVVQGVIFISLVGLFIISF
jgi:hypothetical protein